MYPAIARANFRNSIQVQSDRSVERIDGFLLNGTAPCEGTESIESYALSPDGKIGACVSMFGDAGPLTIFSLHPLKALKSVSKYRFFVNGYHSVMFQDSNHILALVRDDTCAAGPMLFRTRAIRITINANTFTRGPCTLAVIADASNLVLSQFDKGAWQYSIDNGHTWRRGQPQAITDDGAVLYLNVSDDLMESDFDRPLIANVFQADWARQ